MIMSEKRLDWCGMGIDFILGEEKNLPFRVRSLTGQSVVITDAVFKLMSNGEVIQEGKCDIDGQMIYCLIKPTEIGCMYIEIEYVIAPETRKARFNINVT